VRDSAALAAELIRELAQQRLTVAVAESLTGGLLVAELIAVPGASAVVLGGVVAYSTELKHTILGVSSDLLAEYGPVHPDVAAQMAAGVRDRLAVDSRPADFGLSTTGVAGPGPQGEHAAGTAFVGVDAVHGSTVVPLRLSGDRTAIRNGVVYESLVALKQFLETRRR